MAEQPHDLCSLSFISINNQLSALPYLEVAGHVCLDSRLCQVRPVADTARAVRLGHRLGVLSRDVRQRVLRQTGVNTITVMLPGLLGG